MHIIEIQPIGSIVRAVAWTLGQVTGLGLPRLSYPTAIVGVMLVLVIVSWLRLDAARKRALSPWIWSLPAIWFAVAVWGAALRTEGREKTHEWLQYPVGAALWVFAIAAIILLVGGRGTRLFLGCFVLLNLWFMLLISFVAIMMITDSWI